MFNDRSGFRNSSSLAWYPWSVSENKSHKIKAMPCILMDSHIYDYLDIIIYLHHQVFFVS